ncbi:hypothetical protein HQ585_02130 [candidate division KSB1 bacterium]|nr:hypothetical protein [candidate division KSB1 bacterium]
MKRIITFVISTAFLLATSGLWAQMKGLHGDFSEHRSGLHAGNQFRTTFYNDGTFGQITSPPDIGGEWPINSGHIYLSDGNLMIGAEVIDLRGDVKHIVSEVVSSNISFSTGDTGPNGEWWTFLPLPGFANPDQDRIAMSKWPDAWPTHWPDKYDDPVDPGWSGKWNGYFGKNLLNADEESYFVADDYMNREFKFHPDTTDTLRRGLGIRNTVRGFQWSNALVEDALFILFDLENIGTYNHDKVVFGYKIGNNMGATTTGTDQGGDNGAYDKDEDVAFLWDYDLVGASDWGTDPVGYFGAAFMESPGNYYDGIDNDNDGNLGSGPTISENMFVPRTLNEGEDVCLIDYVTFERDIIPMPNDTIRIQYIDRTFKFWPGKVVEEIPHNLVDDNLNGVIDESNQRTFGDPPVTTFLYVGYKYVDYFTGAGSENRMIDERRDDGIDNNGDWNAIFDDNGQDGAPFTNDPGEGDGVPTLGEPHFDKTDINETDMLGLTSFTLYEWADIPLYDDEVVWANMIPGFFDDLLQNLNVELFYGSGYFPLQPGQVQRFSMGIICGYDRDDFIENKYWVTEAYSKNYNFAKAPYVPTLTAVPGDHKVTLTWDSFAEESVDPITGVDFEGYRVYRSTDPGFQDMIPITDGQGSVTYRKPIVQYDLDNEYQGYAEIPLKGVQFWLGTNTGLKHSYVDTTVKNGYDYYYAVTSYDHGDPAKTIAPSECTKFISINTDGSIDKGINVVIVRPEAPVAGFEEAGASVIQASATSTTDGIVSVFTVLPDEIKDGHLYRVTFEDSLTGPGNVLYPTTKNFSLEDVTDGTMLIDRSLNFLPENEQPVIDGFRLQLNCQDTILTLNDDDSGWSRNRLYPLSVRNFNVNPEFAAGDFAVIFGELGMDTSTELMGRKALIPAISVNFTVMNLTLNQKVPFAFNEVDVTEGEEGIFSAFRHGRKNKRDEIIIMTDSLAGGWLVTVRTAGTDTLQPVAGDTAFVSLKKPFLSQDVFEFTMSKNSVDQTEVGKDMERIRVVPNPYIVANSWEPQNPYSNGRGPRELHFINLPAECTIRIFSIRGQLVDTIEHQSSNIDDGTSMWDGTAIWDMQTRDNLDIAYGIYFYHIDAGKIGTKQGKFAVIK